MTARNMLTLRQARGSSLVSAISVALIAAFWMTGLSAYLLSTYKDVSEDRSRCMMRSAAETSLEWILGELNGPDGNTYNPSNLGESVTTNVPDSVIKAVAPNTKLRSVVTVKNIAAPATSYLYDAKLPTWRVVTVDTYVGNPPANKLNRFNHKQIRVALKPIGQNSETPGDAPPTSVPVPMLLANSITFGGSGVVDGDIHSNGNLALSGSNKINGDVSTSGNFSITGSGQIAGNIQSLGDIKLNSSVSANAPGGGVITALGSITTAGSSSVNGSHLSAGEDINLSASMNMKDASIATNGKLTTSGSFSMSKTGAGTPQNIFAKGGQSASGSFNMTGGGDIISLGDINLGWGSTDGKAYYGGANKSPAYSPGAAMNTNGRAVGGLNSSSSIYQNEANKLQQALDAAAIAAKEVPMPPAPEHSPNAIELPATSFTKSGSNNITIPPAGYPADGEYFIKGPIDLSGSNKVTIRGKVKLSLEGPNAYIKLSGSNTILLPNDDPENFQVSTNSSKDISFSGSTNVALGYIYAPNATVKMSGSNKANVGGIIANTIQFSGSSGLHNVSTKDVFHIFNPGTPTTTVVFTFKHWQAVSYQEV